MALSNILIAAVGITLVLAVATLVGMCARQPTQENQPEDQVPKIRE